MMEKKGQWEKLVEPFVNRCKLAAKINQSTYFDAVGSDSLGRLLTEMALRLDSIASMREIGKSLDELEKKMKVHGD